jgi:hypothetical protein
MRRSVLLAQPLKAPLRPVESLRESPCGPLGPARAYHRLNAGDERVTGGDVGAATENYSAAMTRTRDSKTNGAAPFRVGIPLARIGRRGAPPSGRTFDSIGPHTLALL